MSSIDFSEYSDLVDEGAFDVKTPVNPEDEFFHAVYISGQQRQNHLGEMEIPGKLQIRGLRSNLEEINMIITHVKGVLVKTSRVNNRDTLDCFSYQDGNHPWKGTSGKICGKNSIERSSDPFCSPCRAQLIIAGLYLDEKTGQPFLVNGKEVYIFIRAKGIKYGNVANYLSDLTKRDDLKPMVTPVTEESKKFERTQVNHKRFVTKVKVGKVSSSYGMKDAFTLETSKSLDADAVKKILNRSKVTKEKFKEKFDWSRGKSGGNSDYSGQAPVSENQKFNFSDSKPQDTKKPEQASQPVQTNEFSFEDVDF